MSVLQRCESIRKTYALIHVIRAVDKDLAMVSKKDNFPYNGKHRAIHRLMNETGVGYIRLWQSV